MRERARFERVAFVPLCWKEVHRQHGIHDFLGESVVASFGVFAQKLSIGSRPFAEEVFAPLIRETGPALCERPSIGINGD
jgi:hypothetical protein